MVYAIGWTLWLSGVLWLVFHYALMRKGPFGDEPQPLETWWLRLHAAMAFASLWGFGLVWGVHIVAGWRTQRQRISGGLAVGLLVWLSLTGYLLYYLTDDRWRDISAVTHWATGLALPVLLAIHIVLGRRRSGRW
ncbi:hypothetical protein EC912_103215 [Luteibacter rhizovicinus]|uniref:DUF4405 domain-containing protein n=1 Tax=Luteibacter rhizovicinus TaxID=242606 RepID=A0A4R3YQN2_9GAMM|nr:hypothetical protein [Luteibacter rhizovicinus]TCV94730.1 hypothetical protein EC912_103215 [Luteibacter rhizovicinus]